VVRLRDKALSDLFAPTQNQYPIANLKNINQIMRNENHSYPILFELRDYFHDFPLLRHTQSGRRFIHDQHARFPMDCTSDRHRLTLAPRQRPERTLWLLDMDIEVLQSLDGLLPHPSTVDKWQPKDALDRLSAKKNVAADI
jgi:hypothetical protein